MVSRWRFVLILTLSGWLAQPAATQESSTSADSGSATLMPEPAEPGLPEASAAVDEKPATFLKKDWQAPAEPPSSRSTRMCTETVDDDGNLVKRCKPVPLSDKD